MYLTNIIICLIFFSIIFIVQFELFDVTQWIVENNKLVIKCLVR